MTPVAPNTQSPMRKRHSRFLVGYLLIATVLTFYVVYSLWSIQPRSAAGPGPVPVPNCAAGAGLTSLYPNLVNIGAAGSDVLILGCGFTTATQVKFNGGQHSSTFVDASHIRAALSSADDAATGAVVVTLSNNGVDFGSGVLSVVPPNPSWQCFGTGPWPIGPEVQLLLMVLFTGALGSCVYALKSLADYAGDDQLYEAWFTYYLIQPFEGAGCAFLLYLVVRGGLLSGTSGDAKAVNQFGMCAIAGLAGAFSDAAFLKLREIFLNLFKTQDDRGGKLAPKITTVDLPDGAVGVPYTQALQASGGTAPLTWAVTPTLPAGLSLAADSGIIRGTPTEVSPKASYNFTVADSATPAATSSAGLTLAIAAAPPVKIATATLRDGAAGQPYDQALQASGGIAPLKWSVTPPLPDGLSLDAATASISGKPTAASPKASYKFTVTDGATPAASCSADIALEVK